MTEKTNVTFRIDKKLKSEAEELFENLGFNMSTAFITFIKKSVREQRIPFDVSLGKITKKETLEAIEEGKRIKENP
ncbi:MAG: type II toxin-antitoxin system RelB/DinJ family antitoxin [Fusobacteriaceae bacterium]|jgi:DNA-damage-inducible protein J|nr:type II toxin-antitoxin system RelB/DinJ family antitoxin [Fusobacteriaceae bacterium]